jgi:hypothetical protein
MLSFIELGPFDGKQGRVNRRPTESDFKGRMKLEQTRPLHIKTRSFACTPRTGLLPFSHDQLSGAFYSHPV